jgi:hypothetical protein
LTSIVELGRTLAAAAGGLFVFATTAYARRSVDPIAALGASVLTAVAPLTVFHAQLFKEDIFLAGSLMAGLLALDCFRDIQTRQRAVIFGIAEGLAASAKYIGIVLLPLSLMLPLFVDVGSRSRYYGLAAMAGVIGLATFCTVNAPLFVTPWVFFPGLETEVNHALSGHLIVRHGWYSNFAFTWEANLWPGLRAPLAFAGLLGAFLVVIQWTRAPRALKCLVLFGAVWYLMHELSPMKPFPEGARHMTVMSAVFAILAAYAIQYFASGATRLWRPIATAAMSLILAAAPAWATLDLARSTPNDTLIVVERIVAALDGSTAWVRPLELQGYKLRLDMSQPIDSIERTAQFLVINELFAEQYIYSLTLPGQSEDTRRKAAAYAALLRRPALLIVSTAASFAFRNTPYRIVALGGNAESLALAVARVGPLSNIEFRLLPGGAEGMEEPP